MNWKKLLNMVLVAVLCACLVYIVGCDRTPSSEPGLPSVGQSSADSTNSAGDLQKEGWLPGVPPSEYPDAPPIPDQEQLEALLKTSATSNVCGFPSWTILQVAYSWLGVPYRYGGNSRSGVDCSHLVYQVYGGACINYPYYTTAAMKTSSHFICVNPAPGDIITFRGLAHCGIYIGNGWMIDANSYYGQVMYDYIYDSYWWKYGPYAIRYIC